VEWCRAGGEGRSAGRYRESARHRQLQLSKQSRFPVARGPVYEQPSRQLVAQQVAHLQVYMCSYFQPVDAAHTLLHLPGSAVACSQQPVPE